MRLVDHHSVLPLALAVATALSIPLAAQDNAATNQDQEPDIVVELSAGQRPLMRLAMPNLKRPQPPSAAIAAAMDEVESTLRSDLRLSGIFELQGPEELTVLSLTGDASRDNELFRSLGNEIVLVGDLLEEPGRMVLESRLYDLASGQFIFGKRYRGEPPIARRIAHTFADEIVRFFTGRPGVALTSIVFASDRDGDKEIFVMDYDGRNARRITGHKSISMSPAWSPTGDAIAYVSYLDGAPGIYLADLATGRKTTILSDDTMNIAPSISPDGKRVAFSRSLDGNTEIFVSQRDGSNRLRLTHSSGIDTNPAWSPNGREIAFTSSRAGSPHIYVMDAEGTNLRRVSFEGTYNDGAAWSPNGANLAYASRRRGRDFDIVETDLALLETKVLTGGPGSHESPSYAPDGRQIVFTSSGTLQTGRATQLFVIDRQGAHRRQLTTTGNNWSPDWSPIEKPEKP